MRGVTWHDVASSVLALAFSQCTGNVAITITVIIIATLPPADRVFQSGRKYLWSCDHSHGGGR